MYPEGWPKCPGCGEPALDGHITCGSATCNESQYRAGQQPPKQCAQCGGPIWAPCLKPREEELCDRCARLS